MKTELLYMDDSYLKEFDAKVIEVSEEKVVLDKTAFYPAGGGQPTDLGKINDFSVLKVKKEDGKIWHYIDGSLENGAEVHCSIDWERRYKLMRMHTAAHILSAVFYKEAGAKITGNQLDLEKSRIDFNLENFDREKINDYFLKANDIVNQDLKIEISTISREEAEKDKSLFKLAKALPDFIKDIRIVAIGDFDKQADGGTHVKFTKEVGEIEFIKADNKGKSNRRVYFKLK